MSESLHRVAITQSPLWASTILPRVREKRAQQTSVPPVPPVKPQGQAAPKLAPDVQRFRDQGEVGRAVTEHFAKNPTAWKPVAQAFGNKVPTATNVTQNRGVLRKNLYDAVQAQPGLPQRLAEQHGGVGGKILSNFVTAEDRLGLPKQLRGATWYMNRRIGQGIDQQLDTMAKQPATAQAPAAMDPLRAAGANYLLDNASVLNQPGMAAKATAAGISRAPTQRIVNQYQNEIAPHVQPFIAANPGAVAQAGRAGIAAAGGATGSVARAGLGLADAFGKGDQAINGIANRFGGDAFKAYANGQPMGQAIGQRLGRAAGFNYNPAKGFMGSFMDPSNSKYQWGAGGLSMMALLWLMSRMGRR